MITDRRGFLKQAFGLLALLAAPGSLSAKIDALAGLASGALKDDPGNFRAVYLDPDQRDEFFLFLQNVFHLYPEAEFHQIIIDLVKKDSTDAQIYLALLERLPSLKPTLGDLTYALPALRKQKVEMSRQTLEFLGADPHADGLLEIGSPGRYVSALKPRMRITGPVYVVHDHEPSFSPEDVMERGGLAKMGQYIPQGNYDPFTPRVPERSLDLVLNFIGFHHCPLDRLDGFVGSIHSSLRPGGRFILRDHDVDRPSRWSLVALAHDVYNAGLLISWEETHKQVRLFRSLRDWTDYLNARGFKRSEKAIAQAHDPTKNLLVEFTKT
jgi:SAM-dependent methyltransferase